MSFFKAPAWAKSQANYESDEEGDAHDLFSHSKNFLAIQRDAVEQERRRKEKAQQKEEQRERRRKEKAAAKESKSGPKRESLDGDSKDEPVKKRRISSEESAELLASVGIKPVSLDSDSECKRTQYEVKGMTPARRSRRTTRRRDAIAESKTKSDLKATVIQGGSSETESEVEITQIIIKPAPIAEVEEDEDSDPEIAALQRQAREKHRRKKQQQELRSSTPGAGSAGADGHLGPPTPAPPDPVISLFITSSIPGAVELLVKRKLSQDLGTVRRAWCDRQNFPEHFKEKVFFTWNGIRMYDFSTCKRLGLELDGAGNVVRADQRDADGAAQVHVVATTQELLDQQKDEEARKAQAASAQYEPEEAAASAAEPQKTEVKIIVRAKDQRPVHVKVFSTTKISKIVNYARKQLGVAADQPAYLCFDGDRLDPDEVVGNTEMDDLENVDFVLGK